MQRNSLYKLALFLFFVFICLSSPSASAQTADLYQRTGEMRSPPVPQMSYPESYGGSTVLNNRSVLWILIQQHFYLGSLILGTPMIAWLMELFAYFKRKKYEEKSQRLDRLAFHVMQIGLPFYPFTIIFGLILLSGFMILYPVFFQYMAQLFRPVFILYALAFFLESLLFYVYAYRWVGTPTAVTREKAIHLGIGFLLCLNGILIICLANALMSFMMSPKGVDSAGRYLGDLWAIIHTPFWNPLNVHRVLASIMFSGAFIAAYAAFRMLTTQDPAVAAHYDQMGHITITLAIANLCLLPFAGYWFAKEIFIFRQRMGMTLMGGSLSWLFVVQAMLVGFIFMTAIYYLWQGTARMEGSARYRLHMKCLLLLLLISFLIWTTPHTLPATSTEFQTMGGTQHPIVGYYGTMSAKNTAINTMILILALCYIIFRRCNKIITISWRRWGNISLVAIFLVAEAVILFLGVYGILIPANARVALAFPQFITAMSALILGFFLNYRMLKGARKIGPIKWGRLPTSGAIALFVLAFLISTTMSLMGYIRSSVRLNWHITEIMEDVTPWAQTASMLYGLGMVLFNVFLFGLVSVLIFRFAATEVEVVVVPSGDSRPVPSNEISTS
jgi:hypothetical protein